MTIAKIAGKKRPLYPKVLQDPFASNSDADKHDGVDCLNEAGLFRGINSSYAIPRDAINSDLRKEGSPLLRLTGDGFCQNAETFLNLLESITSTVGSNLVNDGVTFSTFTSDDEASFYEKLVAVFNGSAKLTLATESSIEVGTGDVLKSIGFVGTTTGLQYIIMYGDLDTSQKNHGLRITSANKLEAFIDDGTTETSCTDPIASRILDGRAHILTYHLRRGTATLQLYVDGELVQSVASGIGANTLTDTDGLTIGASNTGGVYANNLTGTLSNNHEIHGTDELNALKVLNQGIRESVVSGTMPSLAVDTAKRLNTKYILPATANCYTTTMIDIEDGEYEIQTLYERQASGGTLSLEIDGNVVTTVDTDGSAGSNLISKKLGVKLSAGKHIVKIKNTEANTLPLQWINFIKRKGHELGGCTEFLFLGDELVQRENASWASSLAVATADYYNNRITEDTNGDYTEGDIFYKGGLWEIEVSAREDTTNAGKIDFDIGSVEVLDAQVTNASTNMNTYKRFVRLPQGKLNTRLAVVTGTGTPTVRITSIRGRRISD